MVFLAYPKFHQDAKNAKTPPGDAATFTDLDAQVSTNTYLGLQAFKSYDVQACADYCDATTLCTGFNIFV
jgi:hypothetical protein